MQENNQPTKQKKRQEGIPAAMMAVILLTAFLAEPFYCL